MKTPHRSRIKPRARIASPNRGALSLDGFSLPVLEEAQRVINGTSEWFRFNEEGALRKFQRDECAEVYFTSMEKAQMLRDVAAQPELYREKFATLCQEYRSLKPSARLQELEDERWSLDARLDDGPPLTDAEDAYFEHIMEEYRALEKEFRLARYRLSQQINALKEVLNGAARGEQGTLPELSPGIEDKVRYLSPLERKIVAATLILIANASPLSTLDEKRDVFNAGTSLRVMSDDLHEFTNNMVGEASAPWFYRSETAIEAKMDRMNDDIVELTRLLADPKAAEDEIESLSHEDGDYADVTQSDPNHVMKMCLSAAQTLAYEDYGRFHNSHPEAVKFIQVSRDVQALRGYQGDAQIIADPFNFIGSPFTTLIDGADIIVEPHLLTQAREHFTHVAIMRR